MKKRALSWLLALCMLVSLAPQTIPWAKAADPANGSGKTNAFGLPTEVDPSQQNTDLRSNPYGTKGWVPLFQNHELVVAGVHDDEFQTTYHGATESKGTQISSFRWSNSTDVGNAKRIATVAFDPNGTGRDEYIANLVFDASAQELRLYVTNKERKVSNVVPFDADSKFIKELKFYQTRSMLCLTAGDFNGDGKDTLMVYVPGNNTNTDSVDSIKEYKLEGSNLSYTNRKINLGDVLDGGREALKAMLYHDGNGSNELRAHLSVDMEAGDVDLDGIEELAMTVNVNDLKNKSYGSYTDLEKSYLTVYDGNSKNGWELKEKWKLLNSSGGAQGRARFAGVTIGNFSSPPSNGVAPEVIAVGYYDNNSDFKGCSLNTGKLLLYSYQYQTNGNWTEMYKAQELSANGFTGTGTKGDDNQNPVAVAAVSADGAMTQEYLFVSGSMYQASKTDGSRLTIVDGSGMDKNRGIGGYIINNTGILDYAVGNFDGNPQGREQVYYVEYHKQESFHKEFLCIGQLYKNGSTTTNADGEKIHTASDTFFRWTDGWTYYGKKNCNVAITAADVNEDAVLAKIKEISYGYTDPKVMAILEASPHFSELDSFGNSATSFGQSVGNQMGASFSGSFGFDIMAGFEYVAPIIETGGGIELNTSHTFTVGGGTTNTKTVDIKYANDNAEENSVVMYATPMAYYLYDVKYPEGTQPKKESTMMLSVAMKPVTSIVSVDTYNEAAAAYADMDQIGANVQLGTPGQPNTYRAGLPNVGDKHSWSYGEPKQYYGTGTITESVTDSTDTKVSFEYEYEGSVQAYGIAGGFKVGGGYHWGVSAGTEKVSTEGLTKEGAVNCQNNPHYNFNWEFATWTVKLNGEDVPVLGYLVSNVVAPPSPAENLRLSEQTTNSMVLSWDSGARPAEYYKIYRYIEGRKNPFVLVDTVDASEAASGSYEYKLTGLAANTQYKYAITSGYYTGNKESVESEIAIGKTLASDMDRLHISGPGNVTAPLGQKASFTVTVSGLETYRDFAYQWQMRQPGKKWEDIKDATQNNYTVSEVTSDLNGTMFRCMVEGNTTSSEPIPFYSDAAMLTVGMPTADAALDVEGPTAGGGTKKDPYIGQSDYLSIGQGEAVTETKITSYTATATDGTKLSVYKVDKTNDYIGIGTDSSGNTVYYSVTANADATEFTAAGDKLDESTVYTWKNGNTALTVPAGTSPDTALTKELVSGEQATTYYYQAVVLDDKNQPTEYLYRDGKVYHTDGTEATGVDSSKLYLVHSKTEDSQYILSRDVTTIAEDTQGKETEGAGDTTETKYYELKITTTSATEAGGAATTTYALSNALTYTVVNTIGNYQNPTFTLHQTETKKTVIPETREAGNGTALLLTTTTKNTSNNDESLSVDYTLTITNTSTGTVSTLTGKTGTNGRDTKTWTAPVSGLYAITTTTAGGTASEPQYYLAGVQTVRKTEESETVYTLDSAISGRYGSAVALKTRQQTIKKIGNDISADKSSVVNGVTYKYRLASETNETPITGTDDSFDAPKAGTYVVSAYQDGKKLASTTINIKRKPVKLSITLPGDTADAQTYHAPPHKSYIKFTGKDQLKTGDNLPDGAILINCDLYDGDDKRDTSGRFEITLSLNNGENVSTDIKKAIADLLEKYEFTFVSRKVISEQQTGTVAYSAGEGGTVVARKGANGRTFDTDTAVAYSSVVTFDATPKAGYMVKEWLVNGTPVTSDANGNYVLSDETVDGVTIKNKRLTVKSFSGSDLVDGKLTVEVKFGSDSHKITFSAGEGGSLTAALADGSALTNEQNVPEGSTVTFTAAPSGSKGVKSWTVDGKPYCWPDTTELYRETTLTLKNISKDWAVRVDFTEAEAATHAITANYITESGAAVTGLNITAKLASGTNADLTKVPDGAAVTFTVNGLTSNYTIKEWQVDGQAAAGSVGQTSFTLRNITTHHTVTAVIAVAAEHSLTFKVVDEAGNDIDSPIATLTATSRGKPITSGSQVAAYTPIDFNVKLDDSYYVTGWENAQANESDKSKATLNGWNADTLVTVTIAKKPVVTFAGDENITVTAMQGSNPLTSDHWVEMSSGDIIFTATPKKGWETKEWKSGSTKLNSKAPTPDINDNTTYTEKGEITKDVNIHVTAKEIPHYKLNLSVQDLGDGTYGGTVSANITRKQLSEYKDSITATTSAEENFYRDSDIVITATPAKGYCVQDWTIDGVTKPTRAKTWTLPNWQQNAEVKVRFVKEVSGITFGPVGESSEEGYISAAVSNDESILSSAASGVNIAAGRPIFFTATAQPGYEVEGWYVNNVRDDGAGKQRTYTYPNTTSKSSIYIEPKFQQVEYEITTGAHVTVNNQTRVTARGGTSLTFTATPPTGQQLTGWTVNGEAVPGSGNTLTWMVQNGYTTEPNVTAYHVEAQFSAGKYSVTYNGQPTGGTLTASVDSGVPVSGGTNVTFRATPQEGYEIDQWTVNDQSVSAAGTYTLNVTEDSRVAVSFKQMMKVTASVNGQPGEITITAGGKTVTDGWVSSGTDVTFTVTPDHADDMVQVWKVGETPVAEMSNTADAPLTWTVKNVTADTNVTATLVERPTYTITVTHGENGTVTAEPTSVKRGGSTTITAIPKDTNYYLKKWVVDGSDQTASGKTLTLSEIRKDTTVKAVFDEAISYNVTLDVQGATAGTTVTAKANGSAINPQKDSPANVVGGSELVFMAKPAMESGKNKQMVAEWTVKGHPELTTIANVLKIPSLTSATEVTVKFVPYKGFAIPTDGSGYTVNVVNRTPSDTMPTNEIRENGTLKFTVTPTGKALFTELTVNNVNCLTEPKEGYVTAVKSGTSYTITIPKVTQEITLSATAAEYQLNSKELTEVPSELGNITMEQLKTTLRTHISSSVSTSNIAYLNVELQYKRGNEWVKVTDPSMFPDGGLDVTIPYSTLSTTTTLDSSYNYSVVHMFLTNMNNQTVGSTETLTATAGTNGITFHVNSLSPFAIGWYKNTPTPGGGGGGGGGGGAVSTYTLTFDTNGGSAIDKITKDSGTTIDLAAYKPTRAGYTFAGWFSDKALTKTVTSVKLTANTTVYAKWTESGGTAQNPFVDVKEGAYYYDAVLWAVEQKITSGTSATTFSPDASCTRAQMVTFLWRAAGSPKVENGKNPFADVKADAYYYDAVLWAVEKGVTSGTSATTFSPDATVTRGQTVTFLYRNAGSPEVSGTMPFTDVEADAYYAKAVQWAVQQKITTGTSETTFSPMSDCTRGQIVTFLYRAK